MISKWILMPSKLKFLILIKFKVVDLATYRAPSKSKIKFLFSQVDFRNSKRIEDWIDLTRTSSKFTLISKCNLMIKSSLFDAFTLLTCIQSNYRKGRFCVNVVIWVYQWIMFQVNWFIKYNVYACVCVCVVSMPINVQISEQTKPSINICYNCLLQTKFYQISLTKIVLANTIRTLYTYGLRNWMEFIDQSNNWLKQDLRIAHPIPNGWWFFRENFETTRCYKYIDRFGAHKSIWSMHACLSNKEQRRRHVRRIRRNSVSGESRIESYKFNQFYI